MDQIDKAKRFSELHVKGAPLVLYNTWMQAAQNPPTSLYPPLKIDSARRRPAGWAAKLLRRLILPLVIRRAVKTGRELSACHADEALRSS